MNGSKREKERKRAKHCAVQMVHLHETSNILLWAHVLYTQSRFCRNSTFLQSFLRRANICELHRHAKRAACTDGWTLNKRCIVDALNWYLLISFHELVREIMKIIRTVLGESKDFVNFLFYDYRYCKCLREIEYYF